jgi:hypothetical protein
MATGKKGGLGFRKSTIGNWITCVSEWIPFQSLYSYINY